VAAQSAQTLTYELAGSLDEIRRVAFLLDDEQEAKDRG
jgi:hypothetical protein